MKKYRKKSIIYVMVLLISTTMFGGCTGKKEAAQNQEKEKTEAAEAVTFQDSLDNELTLAQPKKVAVLSGSLADAWQLAGGKITATTEDATGNIEMTDDMVSLGTLKNPSVETMIAENIDFAILSAAIAEHVALKETLAQAGIKTAYFEMENFNEYAHMMKIFTNITGDKEMYKKNVEGIQNEIDKQIKRKSTEAPSVLFLRAYSTGVRAKGSDSMTGQMLKDLGCDNIADSEKSLLEELSMEAIIQADPDVIFVTTMGESEEAAISMVAQLLTSNPAWSGLSAVKNNRYYVLPKELFHDKPNERWGESYRILADDLYGAE